jgi:SUKH superfamily protein
MSMQDVEAALHLVDKNPSAGRFVGSQDAELVAAAESALGVRFPPTYRRFLLELGAGDIAGEEFYGITGPDLVRGPVPNGIWLTLDLRRNGLPEPLVIVSSSGDGIWYALDTSQADASGESPVVALQLPESPPKQIASDFGDFFLRTIGSALALDA